MTWFWCKLVLPGPGVKYKCGEIRVLFALGQALVFLTENGREATRRERWYSFSLREKVAEGRMRVKTLGCYFVKVMRSPSPRPSPAGRGSWEHRHSTFLVRGSILVICRSMVELLAYGRGEFHLAPNQKQNRARWNLPSRIFWRAPKTKKRPSRVGGSLKECRWITSRAGT